MVCSFSFIIFSAFFKDTPGDENSEPKVPKQSARIKSSDFFGETSGRDDATPGFPDVDQVVIIGGEFLRLLNHPSCESIYTPKV